MGTRPGSERTGGKILRLRRNQIRTMIWRFRNVHEDRRHRATLLAAELGISPWKVGERELARAVEAYLIREDDDHAAPIGNAMTLDVVAIGLLRAGGIDPLAAINLAGAMVDDRVSPLDIEVSGRTYRLGVVGAGNPDQSPMETRIDLQDGSRWSTIRKDRLGSLIVRNELPLAVRQAMKGRMLRELVSHPVLDRHDLRMRVIAPGIGHSIVRFLKPAPIRMTAGWRNDQELRKVEGRTMDGSITDAGDET